MWTDIKYLSTYKNSPPVDKKGDFIAIFGHYWTIPVDKRVYYTQPVYNNI